MLFLYAVLLIIMLLYVSAVSDADDSDIYPDYDLTIPKNSDSSDLGWYLALLSHSTMPASILSNS